MLSMTGFGKGRREGLGKAFTVELRSVNHRFLEVKCRLPKGMLLIEEQMERLIKKYFQRGSFSVYLEIAPLPGGEKSLSVDYALAEAYLDAARSLKHHLSISGDLTLQDILRYPEVLTGERKGEEEDLWEPIREALQEACDNLLRMRQDEGGKLYADFEMRIGHVEELLSGISPLAELVVSDYREKLQQRLSTLLEAVPANEDRIAFEVAAFADKSSITEEIVRLGIHISHFRQEMLSREPVGRKLDFLLQEMNREVNTIGSKSTYPEISASVVEMKAEMEKIREQVQNLE